MSMAQMEYSIIQHCQILSTFLYNIIKSHNNGMSPEPTRVRAGLSLQPEASTGHYAVFAEESVYRQIDTLLAKEKDAWLLQMHLQYFFFDI